MAGMAGVVALGEGKHVVCAAICQAGVTGPSVVWTIS